MYIHTSVGGFVFAFVSMSYLCIACSEGYLSVGVAYFQCGIWLGLHFIPHRFNKYLNRKVKVQFTS